MTTVFVTDAGSRSSLAVVRSLGRRGVRVVCGESTRFATSFASKHVDERVVYPDPQNRPAAFVGTLVDYLRDNDVDVLLPVGYESTRLVSQSREQLAEHAIVPVPGAEKFDRLVRKDSVMRQAERLGVAHPRTIYPENVNEACESVQELAFPVVIKPRAEAGSKGLQYVERPEAFTSAYRDAFRKYDVPIVQEQIPRDGNGVGAAFLRWDGEIKARFAYRRLREFPPSGGPSTLRESIHDERLFEAGEALLDDVNWRGVAMVEFKNDPRTDTPKLLEVNPRFWGSLHLPYRCGVEFPWLLVQCALGENLDPVTTYPDGVKCRFLLPGDVLNLLSRRDGAAVREFFPVWNDGAHYDIIDRSDPLPTAGRLAAMARYSVDYDTWRYAIVR
ncbi:ATP-grasp domain-containing protein [Haloprofundus salilacus]|uniref:carboxylate--amine ligase n=1 Tax=Haloprofundus salilacus TaxID=2876190 RepID=UPI001CCCBF7A|nr:ATP-grasp domain-containing protein [Haloprofundus salilacus]